MTPRFSRPATLSLFLVLASCSRPPVSGPRATVLLRDGTRASGTVVSSSASEIQIVGDDQVTRTIPTSQVRSVDYGEVTHTPSDDSRSDAVPADHHHPV